MMQPRNRLSERSPLRSPVGKVEPRFLHPPEECFRRDIDGARGFLNGAMRQQGDDRVLLFAPEFCAVAGHLRTSEDIWADFGAIAIPSPSIFQDRFRLLSNAFRVIDVVTR